MDRRFTGTRGALVAALFLLAVIVGCGGGAEQSLLENYFRAARLGDNTTLGNIATVSYNPRQDGLVQRLTVTNVGEEQVRPLRVKNLNAVHDEARAAADDLGKRQKAYQDANAEAIGRVLKSERSNTPLRGADAEVQAAWAKWRADMAEHAKKVSAARSELNAERGVAELSVLDPRNPVDLTQFDGELHSKEVTINATVVTPDQQTTEKRMVVTMQQAVLKGPDREVRGRWIITGIQDASAPPTSN